MPDYDPKSIPILDDVIETEDTSSENTVIDDEDEIFTLFEAEPVQSEDNLDLFAETSIVAETLTTGNQANEDDFVETTEPQIGIIDDIIDEEISNDIHPHDIEASQQAVITDFEAAAYENSTDISADDLVAESKPEIEPIESSLIDYHNDAEENETVADIQPVEVEQQTTENPVSLESVVDDITKQLMPDLEQQLRFLIQQALEDRLPEDVIDKLTKNHTKSD